MKARVLVTLILLLPVMATANEDYDQEELKALLGVKVRTVQHLALNPTMIRAVRRQNAEKVSMAEIQERDRAWQEDGDDEQFKWTLQQNSAGRSLSRHVSENATFNEAFLTDNQGANVAAFPPTSDYYQGDEEKWTASYNAGDGRVFIGALEYDDSTKVYAVQISAPVLDKGATIGVLVVGVTLDYLDAKRTGATP